MSVYIASIAIPIFFLGRYLSPVVKLVELVSAAGRRMGTGVLDRDVADGGLGVRGNEAVGE